LLGRKAHHVGAGNEAVVPIDGAKSLQTLDCTAVALAVREVSPTPSTETARKPPVATMDAPAFLMSHGS
jgi:hypothetical protein